ncbi:MAG: peptidylprolyl isomerase [Armatimonadetes bacterium]|nr:peptidylprolyl isomerase [Armatimonadota bacterium]
MLVTQRRKIALTVLIMLAVALAAGTAYALTFGADLRVKVGGKPVGFVVRGLRARSAVAATVNEEPILWSEVDAEVARAAAQFNVNLTGEDGDKQRAELARLVLDQLIDQRLILQAARKRGVQISETQVAAEIDRIKKNFGSDEEFQLALSQRNLTMDDVRRLLRVNLTVRALLPLVTKVEVPEAEVRKAFDQRRAQFDQPEQARVSHILIRVEDPKQEERARQTIVLIQGKLAKGEKFADLARQYSQDPGSKDKGGDLGFFGRGAMVPEFEKVAFSLQPGQVSGPVKTQFGYHLILLHEKKPARKATFAEVAPQIRDQLTQERQEALFQKWLVDERKQATIRRLPRPS